MSQTAALRFRRAVAADLPALVALLADDSLGQTRETTQEVPDPAYVTAFAAIDRSDDQLLVVAEMDGRVIGTLQLSFLPGLSRKGAWRGLIEAVRVASDLRSSGIGARMIDHAIALCRARDCKLVQLTTDKSRIDAHRFYDRLGFSQSHFGYKLEL